MADRIPVRNDRPPTDGATARRRVETTEDRRASKRWYDRKAWRVLRRSKLRANPYCELCVERDEYTEAVDVHHKVDRRADEDLAFDWDNLQSLCKPCHSRITGRRNRS